MVDQISSAAAAGIYKNIQKAGQGMGMETEKPQGADFGSLVKNATTEAIDTMRAGEKASADAVTGKANLTDVVDAVTNAELTLNTVIATRDKMMEAYQEILRMPI